MPTIQLKKENAVILKFPLCPTHTEITLLARNFIIAHHFLDFLESFNTHVCIPKQTRCWAPCKRSDRLCISLPLSLCLLSLVPLSSVQKCVPVVCPFPHCAPTVWEVGTPQMTYPFCHWWTLGLFPAWGYRSSTAALSLGAGEREFLSGIG